MVSRSRKIHGEVVVEVRARSRGSHVLLQEDSDSVVNIKEG